MNPGSGRHANMFSAFLHVGADFIRNFTTLALWRLGGDVGTWGRGDVGTWGRGDVGTWGRGDVGTWGRGHWQLVASRTAIMALNT